MTEWTSRSIAWVRLIRWRLGTGTEPWSDVANSRQIRSAWDRLSQTDRTHVLAQLAWAVRHCTTLVPAGGSGHQYAARLHRDARRRDVPGVMSGRRPDTEAQLVAAVILAASERAAALHASAPPELGLSVIMDAAEAESEEVPGPVLDRWTVLSEASRAAAMSYVAWVARRAVSQHVPTTPATRLAHWLRGEARLWEEQTQSCRETRDEFRVPLAQVCEFTPTVQLDAAVRLLRAGTTGTLPPPPYECGGCGFDRALQVVTEETPSGPPRVRLMCEVCYLLGSGWVSPLPHFAPGSAVTPPGGSQPPAAEG